MRFLRAVTLGYDIGMRAMKTSSAGPCCATPTTSLARSGVGSRRLHCQLNAQQMRWLIDYASQQAGSGYGAWQRDTEHMEKPSFRLDGCAQWRHGSHGHPFGLDWRRRFFYARDFFQSYAPNAKPEGLIDNLAKATRSRDDHQEMVDRRPDSVPLDAIFNLRKSHRSRRGGEGDRHHLSTSAAPKVDNVSSPIYAFSILSRSCCSTTLCRFRAAHDKARMTDAVILRQRDKVKVVADRNWRLLPRRVAVVEIILADGTRLREENDTVRGTPENP